MLYEGDNLSGLVIRARMHHKVVGNFGSEANVRSLYFRGFRFNETSDNGACTNGQPAKQILTGLRPHYFENEPDFRPMHTKFERLLSKSPTTLEVMSYYLVVHTAKVRVMSYYLVVHTAKVPTLAHSIPSRSQSLNVMRQDLSNKATKQKEAHLKFGSLTKKL